MSPSSSTGRGQLLAIARRAMSVVRGEHGLDVGDAVRVELLHTDVERGFIDFARA